METVRSIAARLGRQWQSIEQAVVTTEELLRELRASVSDLEDASCAIVVTGSLGRGEACRQSDADWMLLVDGPSNPDHAELVRTIASRLKNVLPADLGETKTFGEIVASHDLVHYIAGTQDTNRNLTRRMLLLAESRALSNDLVRERVIRNILNRYVVSDRSVPRDGGRRTTIPHFLLNDVVRYWRTMASDYASKMWEKKHEGWGIRNIKLRFSRKLLFVWGLIAAFTSELFVDPNMEDVESEGDYLRLLAERIRAQTDVAPLELLARVVEQAGDDSLADDLFSSYDRFLRALSDPATRTRLKSVCFENAPTDPDFVVLRETSRTFRHALTALFFDRHPTLPRLIREVGVF